MQNPKKSPSARRVRPKTIVKGSSGPNRKDRRADASRERHAKALKRADNIRYSHDNNRIAIAQRVQRQIDRVKARKAARTQS